MKATIYHNARCGTSRKALDLLREAEAEVEVIDYLTQPPDRETLRDLYARAGITPREGLRAKEQLAKDLRLDEAEDEAILKAMEQHPILIERPIVVTDKGVRLCRPQERVREIL